MAYDIVLAKRVRKLLHDRKGITESKLFGGVAYLLNGNMCCGVRDELLLLQLGVEGAALALAEPHVQEVDFTQRAIKGVVCVTLDGYRSEEDMRSWVTRAAAFVSKLPPKCSRDGRHTTRTGASPPTWCCLSDRTVT